MNHVTVLKWCTRGTRISALKEKASESTKIACEKLARIFLRNQKMFENKSKIKRGLYCWSVAIIADILTARLVRVAFELALLVAINLTADHRYDEKAEYELKRYLLEENLNLKNVKFLWFHLRGNLDDFGTCCCCFPERLFRRKNALDPLKHKYGARMQALLPGKCDVFNKRSCK